MAKRQSINSPKSRHENPIPNACRVGNLVMSSIITGLDMDAKKYPETLEAQIANVFGYIKADVEAAGGSVADIVKISFWLKDPVNERAKLNDEWLKMFPDEGSRPARHTLTLASHSPSRVQADFVAVVS